MGDIGNDAIQYEHDDNISLKEGVSLSQVPIDDLPMLTQEPTQSPLPLHLIIAPQQHLGIRRGKVLIRIQQWSKFLQIFKIL